LSQSFNGQQVDESPGS